MLLHPVEHPVAIASDERRWNRADVELFSADSRHVQQTVRFVRIAQHDRHTFLLVKLRPFPSYRHHHRKGRRRSRLALQRRRCLHWTIYLAEWFVWLWRRKTRGFLSNHDRAFQLPTILFKIFIRLDVNVRHRAAYDSRCSLRPTR